MIAVALVTQSVVQSTLKDYFVRRCSERGIELGLINVTSEGCKEYGQIFRTHKNVITWNCRMTQKWMSQFGNNVLYIENSLLAQRAGIFVDHRGFFSNSNLCQLKTWQHKHDVDLEGFTTKHFGWKPMAGGDPKGPVLVCLQSSKDCNLQQEFPLGSRYTDKVNATLDLLHGNLSRDRRVLIRPNPRFLEEWNSSPRRIRNDWKVSSEGRFYDILPTCSALVTVNSTCASEAITLGLPVIVLGSGAFTESGAVLDCHQSPHAMRRLFDYRPSLENCHAYSQAVLGRHFLPYDKQDDKVSLEFEAWLNACT